MSTAPTVYAFDVQGHLDAHWAEWLGDVRITHNPDGTSTLVGLIVDQAELHGVLAKLRDLGVALIAVASQPHDIPETEVCAGEEDRPTTYSTPSPRRSRP